MSLEHYRCSSLWDDTPFVHTLQIAMTQIKLDGCYLYVRQKRTTVSFACYSILLQKLGNIPGKVMRIKDWEFVSQNFQIDQETKRHAYE
jgi:hypothetical protein